MEQSTEHAGFQVIGRIPGAEPLPQSVRERTKGGEAPATAAGRAAFLRFKARINHVGAQPFVTRRTYRPGFRNPVTFRNDNRQYLLGWFPIQGIGEWNY
jgi:hypothetical protein